MEKQDLTLSYNHVPYDNPYQGIAKRVLCVCSAGLLRSPTAAEVLRDKYGYNTRAAGAEPQFALIPVSAALIMWADEIVCMSSSHKADMLKNFGDAVPEGEIRGKTIVLHIPDNFAFRDARLQKLILQAYDRHQKGRCDPAPVS